jgi:hypothetical protein
MTVQEITKIAEARWEECHGCDNNDKNFWMNGFITGYLIAENENIVGQDVGHGVQVDVIDLIQFLSMDKDFNGYGSVSKETAKHFLEQFKKQ